MSLFGREIVLNISERMASNRPNLKKFVLANLWYSVPRLRARILSTMSLGETSIGRHLFCVVIQFPEVSLSQHEK
jgi:hypothetical protein